MSAFQRRLKYDPVITVMITLSEANSSYRRLDSYPVVIAVSTMIACLEQGERILKAL